MVLNEALVNAAVTEDTEREYSSTDRLTIATF